MFKNQKIILLSCFLFLNSFSVNSVLAQDAALDGQRNDCAKDSSMEWNPQLNRCITRVAAKAMRNEADACNKIEDINSRSQCHKALAEKNSGVQSDPSKAEKLQGNSLISMAYAALGVITMFGKSGKESTCTSKKIFGMTSLAGSVADIMMKIQAKKKMKKLEEQFQVDKKQNAYQSQVKALEYLREEQETVKDIAGKEKTRNMLMTAGFGAAALMAIYEMTPYSQNPDCYKRAAKEEDKKDTKEEDKKNAIETENNKEPVKQAESYACGNNPDECGPTELEPVKQDKLKTTAQPEPHTATTLDSTEVKHETKMVADKNNPGKMKKIETLSYTDKATGKTHDIIDNNIYERGGNGKPIGTLSYGKNGGPSTINIGGKPSYNVGNVVSKGQSFTITNDKNMFNQKFDWRSGGMKKVGK